MQNKHRKLGQRNQQASETGDPGYHAEGNKPYELRPKQHESVFGVPLHFRVLFFEEHRLVMALSLIHI